MSGTPISRAEQQRRASAAYREQVRAALAAVPPEGSVVLRPEQADALRVGLARLAEAVDAHAQALDAFAENDTDETSDAMFTTRLDLAEAAETTMLGWLEILPETVLPSD